MAKTTAIRAPTTDPVNHQIVLRQLKEASETANRLRGNARDSFAQVGELVDAGIVRLVDDKLVSPSPSSLPPTVVPSTRQIKTGGSIQGGGTLATDLSLELVGDAGSPGNSMLYGTNGSGVKGWYTQPLAATTLSSLADVSITSLTNGQSLVYNSTASKWENQTASGATALASLTDVSLTSPTNGQALVYNSTAAKWENQTISSGGGGNGYLSFDSHPSSPNSANDEFEGLALSSQWTVQKNTAAVVNYSSYALGSIWIKHSGNTGFVISQPFAPGTADVSVTMKGNATIQANYDSLTLQLSDSPQDLINVPGTSNGLSLSFTGGSPIVQVNCWTNGTRSQSSAPKAIAAGQTQIYLHLQRVSGTWTFWYSYNGTVFLPASSAGVTVPTFTIGYIVLVSERYGATAPSSYFSFDFVRVNQIFL
jgi:hypothetical protein